MRVKIHFIQSVHSVLTHTHILHHGNELIILLKTTFNTLNYNDLVILLQQIMNAPHTANKPNLALALTSFVYQVNDKIVSS